MREKRLLINSILYFFGSLGKGIASIVVVFIASFYVKPDELGIYDLVISTITLLQPVIIFQINDGIYRWLLENPDDKNNIIRSGFAISFRNIAVANFIFIPICYFAKLDNVLTIAILLNLNCIYPVFQQITRGLKNHQIFAISGIINGLSMLAISYALLVYFKTGIVGFYIAQIISNVLGIFYISQKQHIIKNLINSSKELAFRYSIPMQKYSIMLVPNSINQWIMKTLDKYCILYFLSTYENGIYTVAHRFPDILIMLNSMFYSAWVEQSIVEYNSDDRDAYFSKIYDSYSNVIISVVLIAIPITKYILAFVSGSDYQSSYQYVPFLYIAVIFLGLSGFIGTGYLGTKKTSGIMWTSLAGSATNVLINIFLMPSFGLQIAGISSVCAYFTMWLIRIFQTQKFFTIKIKWVKFISLMVTAFIFASLVQINSLICDVIMAIIGVTIFAMVNRRIIVALFKSIAMKIKHI